MQTRKLISEIVRHVLSELQPEFFKRAIGTVVAMDLDGTCTVTCIWGQFSKVKVLQPWPETILRFEDGAVVILAWPEGHGGIGQLPHIVGFTAGVGTTIEIFSDPKPAARENDEVEITISLADAAELAKLAAAMQSTTGFVPATVPPLPPTAVTTMTFKGKITKGSEKIKLG